MQSMKKRMVVKEISEMVLVLGELLRLMLMILGGREPRNKLKGNSIYLR